jgi:hypothetical protein
MTTPLSETIRPESTEETLRLKCPTCGGGLNLKRRHLGITGQCVHCQSPLTALERNGTVEVVAGFNPRLSPEVPATPAPVESTDHAAPEGFASHAAPAFGSLGTEPEKTAFVPTESSIPASSWGFPDPASTPAPSQEEEIPRSILDTAGPAAISEATLPPAPAFRESALFGGGPGSQNGSFSSMFKNDDSSEINPAWGTKVPQENHASISPFATGSASGGGFAESLFRDKVVKESEQIESMKIESPLFASPFLKKEETPPAPARPEYQKKVHLDGDGRPMRPMTKEEEATFAKHLFAVEKTHKRPRWVTKMIKTLVTFSILGAIGTGVFFFTPEEKLADWKKKAYDWLEPGLAILDYVPEGLRPDWLPRTSLGIDAGVDENGVPKKKLNAFEGLDKLKGDIGNMRGTAEDELKNINKF